MNKTSELIALLSQFNPLTSPEPIWSDLASSEPLLPKLSDSEKSQVISLLQQHLKVVTNEKRKQLLQHLLSMTLNSALPPTLQHDDIDYMQVFNQAGVKEQIKAIMAIQSRTEEEKSRLSNDLIHEESKLKKLTRGTDMYINTIAKQLSLYQEQLQLEAKTNAEQRINLENLAKDIEKQDKDIRLLHQKKVKYDERLRLVEQEYKNISSERGSTPHETQLLKQIAFLEQSLFETTKLLKNANTESKIVNDIIGIEQVSVSNLKLIIDNLRNELQKSETLSESWKKQYQEVQTKLANVHLTKLDQSHTANKSLQETTKRAKAEANEIRTLYNTRSEAYNALQDDYAKLQNELQMLHGTQEASLIALRQELESAKADSSFYRERFERMQANETERNNHMRVTLEAEFSAKHENDMTKLMKKLEQYRQEATQHQEKIRMQTGNLRRKEAELKLAQDTMNEQRRLDSQNIGKLTERIRVLEKDITTAKQNLAMQADIMREKENEYKATAQVAKYNDAIIRGIKSTADAKVKTFEEETKKANETSVRMRAERDQASAQVIQLRAQMEQLRSNLLVSSKTGVHCDQQIAILEKKAANDLKAATDKLTTVEANYSSLKKQLAESEAVHKHSDRIKEELTTERKKVATYLEDITRLQTEISSLKVTNHKSLSEKTAMQALLKQCSVAQKTAEVEQDKYDQRIQDLSRLHDIEKNNFNALALKQSQSIAEQELTINELQQRIVKLTTKLQETDNERSLEKAQCRENLTKQIKAKDAAINALLEMQRK